MYLQKLEVHGFKSFAQSATLEFQRGISAVVGPNGSGKSNIADALRFVLGEQSMKSIRSKKSEDLIFSGSTKRARMNMASVALHFDNHDHMFPIDFTTVVIQRKIFRDGENQYYINGAQVRLKDLTELIAKAKLGLKGYTIINQGMGDAILESSPKERKEIIFEALGLKEFQLKRADAIAKLSHTHVNLEKAEGITREIEPHLKFLKRQAEKIEERQELEEKLRTLERMYMHTRLRAVDAALDQRKQQAGAHERRIVELREAIDAISLKLDTQGEGVTHSFEGVSHLEAELMKEEVQRNSVEREIGKIEGMIAALEGAEERFVALDVGYVREKLEQLNNNLADALHSDSHDALRSAVHEFSQKLNALLHEVRSGNVSVKADQKAVDKSHQLREEGRRLSGLLEESGKRVREIKEQMRGIYAAHDAEKEKTFVLRNEKREKELTLLREEEKFSAVNAEAEHFYREREVLHKEKEMLESRGVDFRIGDDAGGHSADEEETRRNIERLRLRLENIDLIDENIKKEYDETLARYNFLIKETEDLRNAISSLHKIIEELDGMISVRFKDAFKKINEHFNEYFSLLFDGGSARLEMVAEERELTGEEGEIVRERKEDYGVDVDVSLPRKKTTGLAVLSGGERALTSLALLFALVSTSPPPFLVLDEIDAPLDEANSLRFSKILHELKSHTQFVIITHNRETMRQADTLYGVTMQEDGVSKLLSLKFGTPDDMVV
ncbi:hypothetical protein A2Z10_00170 [Candidatus Azambacteria bacterium RBG_16_47_10]|uniref:RecF/RecN/SMC N-terminal domain-containing protein n=1 Tax=Candidatus Azambacteria bacterium RBG_16_47_10 TaxID=1797292 RepID=A0A1F5AYI8_9BACT|nr:MAG: hypothetical protein A2Z10_00170 [Candidatus Azambacteria bacterium RBG_16_47_10]